MSSHLLHFLLIFSFLMINNWTSAASISLRRSTCPDSGQNLEIYQGATPYANTSAGAFIKLPKVFKLDECVEACCYNEDCHYSFFPDGICFMLTCRSNKFCEPLLRNGAKFDNTYLVKVRDPDGTMIESNEEILEIDPEHEQIPEKVMTVHRSSNEDTYIECTYNAHCASNEECRLIASSSSKRRCECMDHFIRDQISGRCILATEVSTLMQPFIAESLVLEDRASGTNINTSTTTTTTSINVKPGTTLPPPEATTSNLRHLIVSAGEDKVVQLPDNVATLSAYALSKESEGENYKYKWTLVSPKSGEETGSMSDTNSPTLKLSDLKEGSYTFKVAVSSDNAYGEAFANVTVLRPIRENKPPVAKINPVNQTVKLPNSDTILDGSASEDDDKIIKYVWEMVQAPLGYQAQLTQTATLQLKNLIAGNYRIMLIVTDSDGVTNSTNASLNVTKETDYPPTALTEPDVIIYLPQNEVTINGNGSWDDKGIKSWEWTKGDGMDRAVDMQNSRTPYLHLSNLDVGMYTFELKVTDTADQTSTAQVHVFVKPGNEGPVADAGKDQEIMLPTNTVTLDGSASHDDIGISRWEWKQVSGPTISTIGSADQAKAIVTNLSAGVYVFQLTVYDDKKSSNSKTVAVTVVASKNDPPKANAGGDQSIELPCNLIVLNGSASTDDIGIVKYEWMRDSASLAVGEILHGTDHTALLMLTSLLPGRYVFKLTVYDAGGVFNSDTASVIVKPAPHELDDVEICIANDITSFNEEQKVTIAKKIALLLQEELETTVIITSLVSERNTNRVIMTFHVEQINYGGKITIEPGVNVAKNLKKRLKADSGILGIPIVYIDTTICQNNCSGHGFCDKFTKRCTCEAFWMENFFAFYFGDQESNCDWSILYVTICIFIIVVGLVICGWGIVCLCSRKKKKSHTSSSSNSRRRLFRVKRRQRYTLLENNSEHESVRMLPKNKGSVEPSLMISDSDLESDLIFEKNGKPEMKPAIAFSKISRNSDEDENLTQQLRM